MRRKKEIKETIEGLNKELEYLYKRKKITQNESTAMRNIDNRIDKTHAQIRILEWVIK